MPRSSNGTYSLPQVPFVPGTTISSAAVNSNFSDIATALTQSLATTGVSTMTGALLGASGSAAAPSYTFSGATSTGLYLAGTNKIGWSAAGTQQATFNADGTVTFSGVVTAAGFNISGGGINPIGQVALYAGASAPSGWQLCGGQAISRTTYSALFAVIGGTYGTGDGSTTFNVPDCRGRGLYGKDDMATGAAGRITVAGGNYDGTILGNSGGGQNQTLTQAQLPAVAPTFSGNTINLGTLSGNQQFLQPSAGGTVAGGSALITNATPTVTIPPFTPSGTISNLGSGASHPVLNPSIIFNVIIFSGVP